MTPESRQGVRSAGVEEFLAGCAAAARGARVEFLPGRAGVAADYAFEPNAQRRSVLDGQAARVEYLSGLHLRARCEFRVPLECLPKGARLVADGDDREVLLPGQREGGGEAIAESVVLEGVLESVLVPEGLAAFAAEQLRTHRGWSDLRPRFRCCRPAFELRRSRGGGGELWCCFTAEMDA